MAAKQIIILSQLPGNGVAFQYALWATVPLARQPFYAKVGAVSQWTGASAAENAAIAAGQVTELVKSQGWPAGTTTAVVRGALQTEFTTWQTSVTNGNNWAQYGTFWDGTAWTQGGVA